MKPKPTPTRDEVAAMLTELAAIRTWEHRFQDYDDPEMTVRTREIMAQLKDR